MVGSVPQKRITALAAAGLLLAACAGAVSPSDRLPGETAIANLRPVELASGERLRVVATTSFVAEVIGEVGGDSVDLTMLLPLGADPHSYEPTPQDVRTLAEAHVVFINGFGLEAFLARTLKAAGGRAAVVSLSEGIEPRALAEGEGNEHEGVDPHVWLDPLNMIRWGENAATALAALDRAQTEGYRARAAAYASRLQRLDEWIRSQVDMIPAEKRRLVTDHEELGYFAARYGFDIVGALIPAYSSAAEPSAQDLAELISKLRDLRVTAVFVSSAVNPNLAARVAQDTGMRLVPLYTHSLTDPSGPAPTYVALMEYNVRAIADGLR